MATRSESDVREGVPDHFTGWIVKPMPFREECGKGAKFSNYDAAGLPNVVQRLDHSKFEGGCVAYSKHPIPVGKAWRVTLLQKSGVWRRGLVSHAR